MSRKPRQKIFQLSQLHLKLSLIAAGALGKDIKNELTAIDDSNLKRGFQVALLRRGQILINDDKVRLQVLEGDLDFLDFAAANQGRRSHPANLLAELLDDFAAGGFRQPLELLQAVFKRNLPVVRGQLDTDQEGSFFAATQVGSRLLQDSKE